jgi:hypothetical protein
MSLGSVNWSLETAMEDVLVEIYQYLLGFDIYHLHLVSKGMKMRILKKNSVKMLVWRDDKLVKAVPSFAFQFHLQVFTLMMTGVDEALWYTTGEDILKLPKSLKTLRLGFHGAHSVWFANYRPKKVKSHYVTNITGTDEDFEHLYNLKTAFPHLETLHLSGENAQLGARLLVFFSPTLTSATINSVTWNPKTIDFPLPPNLRHLCLTTVPTVNWDHFAPLSHLERLELANLNQEPPQQFPPALQSLSLGWGNVPWPETSLVALSQLSTLTSLYCGSTGVVPYLPNSLTELRVSSRPAIMVEHLKNLPRSLKILACYTIAGDFSSFDFWPPNLTNLEFSLEFADIFHPKDERWLLLPKGLTHLSARTIQYSPIEIHPSLLPPLIKSRDVRKYGLENEIFDYSHLQALSWLYVTIFDSSANPVPPKPITTKAVAPQQLGEELMGVDLNPSSSSLPKDTFHFILPSRLTIFAWNCHHYEARIPTPVSFYFRDSFTSWLPDSLTTFRCDGAQLLTNQFFAQLPRKLLELVLDIPDKTCLVPFSSEGFKVLPPHLTTLQTVMDPSSDDSFVPFLPRSLTSLDISRMTKFNDDSVQHLPRGLKHFHMRHLLSGMSDACIPSLPRELETLELEHERNLTPEAFFARGFPRLTFIDIRRNPNFTKARVLPLAPPTLNIKGKKFRRE